MTTPLDPYAWVAWLGERDAQVLLLYLMQGIEQDCTTLQLKQLVQKWRRRALRALDADDSRATIDEVYEVRVDARLEDRANVFDELYIENDWLT